MRNIFHGDSILMKVMTWISDMVHLQLLWVMFTFVGLVVGGLFPATYSLFSSHRQLMQRPGRISKNSFFWQTYKKNFIKSNLIGYTTILLFIASLYHLRFSLNIQSSFFNVSSVISLGLILIVFLLAKYVWTVAVHFNLNIFETFKHAFIIEVSFPIHTIGVLLSTIIFVWSARVLPVLVPFFSVAAYTFCIMGIANHAFKSVENSKK